MLSCNLLHQHKSSISNRLDDPGYWLSQQLAMPTHYVQQFLNSVLQAAPSTASTSYQHMLAIGCLVHLLITITSTQNTETAQKFRCVN
jgi:hypothetical protein